MFRLSRKIVRHCLLPSLLMALWCSLAEPAAAQMLNYSQSGMPEDPGLGLLQEEPHDLIFFTQKAEGGWVKAHLLDLPGRKPPPPENRGSSPVRRSPQGP